jgi:hypothetical protein
VSKQQDMPSICPRTGTARGRSEGSAMHWVWVNGRCIRVGVQADGASSAASLGVCTARSAIGAHPPRMGSARTPSVQGIYRQAVKWYYVRCEGLKP